MLQKLFERFLRAKGHIDFYHNLVMATGNTLNYEDLDKVIERVDDMQAPKTLYRAVLIKEDWEKLLLYFKEFVRTRKREEHISQYKPIPHEEFVEKINTTISDTQVEKYSEILRKMNYMPPSR